MSGSARPASITATTRGAWRSSPRSPRATTSRMLALGDVLYHAPERRRLQDVLSCVREQRTLETAGRLLEANAERHMKSAAEMARLFADYPEADRRDARGARAARTSRSRSSATTTNIRWNPPARAPRPTTSWCASPGTARRERYPDGVPESVRKLIEHELAIIRDLKYEAYFLTVRDIMDSPASEGHPLPGARLGGQLRRLLLPRHHRRESRRRATSSSSASSRATATSRPTSTSISSTSGARR